jgi:hypothetical protein
MIRPIAAAALVALALLPGSASADVYRAANGEQVRIESADDWAVPAEQARAWADFLASLPHRDELSRLTVLFVPSSQMNGICESEDAAACFDPAKAALVLPGDWQARADETRGTAAHEFGHAIAWLRANPPWRALSIGPKRWASHVRACSLVAAGQASASGVSSGPGQEWARQMGEVWADTYRRVAERMGLFAGSGSWRFPMIAPPDAATLDVALRDVLEPWSAPRRVVRRKARKGQRWTIPLSTPLDGTVAVKANHTGTLRVALQIVDARTRAVVAASRAKSYPRVVSTDVCGRRTSLALRVRVTGGRGRLTLTLREPSG